jgi:hypothetical protein
VLQWFRQERAGRRVNVPGSGRHLLRGTDVSKCPTAAKAALLSAAILACGFAAAPVGATGRPTHTPTSHVILGAPLECHLNHGYYGTEVCGP